MIFRRLLFERYLDKNEQLFYTIHRHWITTRSQMLKIAVFGYVFPLSVILFVTGWESPASLAAYIWMFFAFCYTVYAFLDWYLDAWLITDVSIIDTSWDGFFRQRSSRVDYESIESVDIEVIGVVQSLFNYGKITLIRSSNIHVEMNHVHNPSLASSWITRVQSEVTSNKSAQDSESLKALLADIIQEHIKVNS